VTDDGAAATPGEGRRWPRRLASGLGVAAALVGLDQVTKALVLDHFLGRPGPARDEVLPVFDLVLTFNRGVSFGMFGGDGDWQVAAFTTLAVVVSVVLAVWMARSPDRVLRAGLGLIVGGAIGNAIDRVRFGAVVDFIDLHAAGWHWPAFNVADAAITVGAVVLLWDALFGSRGGPIKRD